MIPVCIPTLTGKESRYVNECLRSNWISSRGKFIAEFERGFARYCGVKFGVATTNGTTALHLALVSLGIKPADEVILPAFTMISSAFAVYYCGAKPVLVDADPGTWTIDAKRIEEKITPKTKAIMPVHIYGHPCDMDAIIALAKKYRLYVVEDAAEAHGAEYKNKKCGSFSDAACFSFYANKIITCGEGGMLITDSAKVAKKAACLKDLSFLKERRFLHKEIGFNYRMTNLQAAIGLAQLEKIDRLVDARRRNAHLYNRYLKDIEEITLPPEEKWAKSCYWMYGVLANKINREKLIKRLAQKGVETRNFFIPMHQQPVFNRLGWYLGERYPVAEDLARRGFYLPSTSGLKPGQIKYISAVVKKCIGGQR